MFSGKNVNLFVEIVNPEFFVILQKHLQDLSCVDNIHLITHVDSPYVDAFIASSKLKNIVVSKNNGKKIGTFQAVKQLAKPNVINLFIGDGILHISPKWDIVLASSASKNKTICPLIIGTSRGTYLSQVMGLLPTRLTRRFDLTYTDDFQVYDLPPDYYNEIHIKHLGYIKNNQLNKYNPGRKYCFQSDEHKPREMLAWIGELPEVDKSSEWVHFTEMQMNGAIVAAHWSGGVDHTIVAEYRKIQPVSNASNVIVSDQTDSYLPIGLMMPDTTTTFHPKFAISSHISNSDIVVPHLLSSLLNINKVAPEDIVVVIGGNDTQKVEKRNNIIYSYTDHNSFDHTALIDIIEKEWNGDQWFITHDTARFGPKMVSQILSKGPISSHRSLLKDGWLNMGLFSKKYIYDLAPYILSLKNCNKMQAILSERMYNRFDTQGYYDHVTNLEVSGPSDIYGDGISRSVLHFKEIDLYKYQTFYHMSEATRNLVDQYIVERN